MQQRYDVLIVGGGVLGTSVALHLAEAGKRVLLLEQREIASGASGGNLGQLSISDRCTEPWHMALAQASFTYYRENLSRRADIEFHQEGACALLCGEVEKKAGQEVISTLQQYGIDGRLYCGADMAQKEPDIRTNPNDALLFNPMEGRLNPLLTTFAFAQLAKRAGAQVLENSPVQGFDIENGRIVAVHTNKEVYHADWVVNCAGPYASFVGDMAGVPVPVGHHKGTAFVTQSVAPVLQMPLLEGRFLVKTPPPKVQPSRIVGLGAVQMDDGSLLIAQATERCDIDDTTVSAQSIQPVAQKFLQYFPQLKELQIVRAWAAPTSFTPDGMPVFGPSEHVPNFFTVAGFKGAFTVAPEVGRLAALALCGKEVPLLSDFGPDRLAPPVHRQAKRYGVCV